MNSLSLASEHTEHMQKALKERGIDSMVADARESTLESDQEYMKRRCKSMFNVCADRNTQQICVESNVVAYFKTRTLPPYVPWPFCRARYHAWHARLLSVKHEKSRDASNKSQRSGRRLAEAAAVTYLEARCIRTLKDCPANLKPSHNGKYRTTRCNDAGPGSRW